MEPNSRLYAFDTLYPDGNMIIPAGRLFQISELSVIRGGEIAGHTQFCDEITCAISGKAMIYSGSECIELAGGQIHFIKKGLYHKIVAKNDENFRYICIGFIPNPDYSDIAAYLVETKELNHTVVSDDGNIRILSEQLINETYSVDAQSNTMINLYITQILLSLYRLIHGKLTRGKISGPSASATVYHTLRYIDREYLNIKNVRSIADALSYSEYYLSHLFKEKTGKSIKEYITEKKINNAAQLLKTSPLSIGEISDYLGFATPHTFSQAFKRIYNISPSEYRKF